MELSLDVAALLLFGASALVGLGGLLVTVRQLTAAVEHLRKTVHQLEVAIAELSADMRGQRERLERLEARGHVE